MTVPKVNKTFHFTLRNLEARRARGAGGLSDMGRD